MKHLKMHYCGLDNPYAGEWPNNLVLELLSMNDTNQLPAGDLTARVKYMTSLLPQPDAKVVIRRYRYGNTFPQIAEKLSLPTAYNAKRHLTNALIRLSDPVYVNILLTGELPSAEDLSAHSVYERFSLRTANHLHRLGIHTLADVSSLLTDTNSEKKCATRFSPF